MSLNRQKTTRLEVPAPSETLPPEVGSGYGTANDSEIGPDFYPKLKVVLNPSLWTVIWIDGEGQLVMDYVDALDAHGAKDAARKEHEGDPDAVTGDVIVLYGHQWDEALEPDL